MHWRIILVSEPVKKSVILCLQHILIFEGLMIAAHSLLASGHVYLFDTPEFVIVSDIIVAHVIRDYQHHVWPPCLN